MTNGLMVSQKLCVNLLTHPSTPNPFQRQIENLAQLGSLCVHVPWQGRLAL